MTDTLRAGGFFSGKNVLITGHTGFKGSWLTLWLGSLGARVTGYSLDPPTDPNLFDLLGLSGMMQHLSGDIADSGRLGKVIADQKPDIIFHLAAQSLVRKSYDHPRYTYETNIMGTVNVLEAVRSSLSSCAVINVTSDKCYENREWVYGYRENDPMGGHDPYSSSKACSELVTAAYRRSFFNPRDFGRTHRVSLSSVRAGNVIGGGDWAADRLVPDCIRSLLKGEKIVIRNPGSVRPWQHVLDPLRGYLMLARKLFEEGAGYAEGWNFGPEDHDVRTVEWLVKRICSKWGQGAGYVTDAGEHVHEAHYLKLDCSNARARLGWSPLWDIQKAVDSVVEWTGAYRKGEDIQALCLKQIDEFTATAAQLTNE